MKTAKFLCDMVMEEAVTHFVKLEGTLHEILTEESPNVKDRSLRGILPVGFAIHHGGMSRPDRSRVEGQRLNTRLYHHACKGCQPFRARCDHQREPDISLIRAIGLGFPAGTSCRCPDLQDDRPAIHLVRVRSRVAVLPGLLNQRLPIESQSVAKLAYSLDAEIIFGITG